MGEGMKASLDSAKDLFLYLVVSNLSVSGLKKMSLSWIVFTFLHVCYTLIKSKSELHKIIMYSPAQNFSVALSCPQKNI